MSEFQCIKPFVADIAKFPYPCRKCPPCIRKMRQDWFSRMLLESYQATYMPLFTTFTYKPEVYQDFPRFSLQEAQKLFKRLRRRGHDIRYFMSIERGSKRGRLHNHAILFSKSLYKLHKIERWKVLSDVWANGRVDSQELRGIGGLYYTSKYITKDLYNIDRETGEEKSVRSYSWSNRPQLGNAGLERWRYLIYKRHQNKPYTPIVLPPRSMGMIYNKKLQKVYIPSPSYMKFIKEDLQIDLAEYYYPKEDVESWQEEIIKPVTNNKVSMVL